MAKSPGIGMAIESQVPGLNLFGFIIKLRQKCVSFFSIRFNALQLGYVMMLGCCGWSFINETNITAARHSSARSNALMAFVLEMATSSGANRIIEVLLKYCTMIPD